MELAAVDDWDATKGATYARGLEIIRPSIDALSADGGNTVRRPGQPTEQASIGAEEVITTVHDLGVRLTAADEDGLRRHLAGVSRNGHES